ncbi:TIGR00304 family protein [Methanolobus sediminis]|uniref:TIGR00304 family protein n=1 Tax=Methanolobus sediminis TaxID=3072978 RepID=A0AA51UIV4_9EURY|nr:TIGR00304 family protein [Methanolobus sediminis]WMW24337.1 TIGR00304 family protein [Methanolobus sediminis]
MMLGTSLVLLGIILIIAGFVLIFISGVSNSQNREKRDEYSLNSDSYHSNSSSNGGSFKSDSDKTEVRGGGLIMLGPIPIIIGSDNKSAQTLMILAIVLMVLYFLLFSR